MNTFGSPHRRTILYPMFHLLYRLDELIYFRVILVTKFIYMEFHRQHLAPMLSDKQMVSVQNLEFS